MITGLHDGFRTLECGEVKITIVVPKEKAQEALKMWHSEVAVMTLDEAQELANNSCKCGGECEKEKHGL